MSQLIRLQDIQATHRELIGDDYYDPTGKTAYGINEEKIGKIEGALVEDTTGRIRYLIVDVGGWFSAKEVLAPAGLARIVGDDVFFDSLTKSQVEAMEVYDHDYQYSYKEQYERDRRTFGAETLPAEERMDIADHSYNAPERFAPLEERLVNNRDHIAANTPRRERTMDADHRALETGAAATTAAHLRSDDVLHDDDENTLAGLVRREGLNVDSEGNIVNKNGAIIAKDHISAGDILRVHNR